MGNAVMSRRYVHDPIQPAELVRLLNRCGLSARQFSRASGADERRVVRWLSGEQADPPLWVPVLMTALAVPAARDAVRQYLDEHVRDLREDDEGGLRS